jgi:hypothetical protein
LLLSKIPAEQFSLRISTAMHGTQRNNATRLSLPGFKKSVLLCIPAAFVMKPSQKQFLINMTNSGLTNSGSVQIM